MFKHLLSLDKNCPTPEYRKDFVSSQKRVICHTQQLSSCAQSIKIGNEYFNRGLREEDVTGASLSAVSPFRCIITSVRALLSLHVLSESNAFRDAPFFTTAAFLHTNPLSPRATTAKRVLHLRWRAPDTRPCCCHRSHLSLSPTTAPDSLTPPAPRRHHLYHDLLTVVPMARSSPPPPLLSSLLLSLSILPGKWCRLANR